MAYELPPLPFAMDALEPFISKRTLEFHYGKHHKAYVNNLNNLVPGTEFEGKSLEDIIKTSGGGVFNNGAQVWNHTFYWNCLAPNAGGAPTGTVEDAIVASFGSFESFKDQFSKAAATLFGAGWAWLVKTPAGKLEIIQESNAGNPLKDGYTPLLTCDVWEHAYYIDKQNRRPDYISDFWNLVNWNGVKDKI